MLQETALHETIKDIKKQLRLAMNGIVSSHQRNQGLNYKINFGVEIPRLKAIASGYSKSKELALALWQDNIRECKLLAIFLLPQENYREIANAWTADVPFTEIADHLAKTILCNTATAADDALSNIQRPDGLFRYCGYMTLSHLFRQGKELTDEQTTRYLEGVRDITPEKSGTTAVNAAYNSLIQFIANCNNAREKAVEIFSVKEGNSTLMNLIEE